jgi:hypothetical protein
MELAPCLHDAAPERFEEMLGTFRELGYRFYDERRRTPIPMAPEVIAPLVPALGSINVVAKAG